MTADDLICGRVVDAPALLHASNAEADFRGLIGTFARVGETPPPGRY